MMSIFIGFFTIFLFFLYPFQDILHPHHLSDRIQQTLPMGFQGFIALFRNWTFTLFYVMSEMWSTIIMTVLLWGFANDVTSVGDAKRYYGLLGIGINISGIVAGQVATSMSRLNYHSFLPFGNNAWDQAVFFLTSLVIVNGILCMLIFRYMHKKKQGYNSESYCAQNGSEKIKMGMRKNFGYLAKSPYLICIAIIVITYNIAINLIEVVWKDQVKQLYPNPADFNAYMGQILKWIGIVSTITSIFISSVMIRRFSWTFSALASPFILLFTGIAFFACFFFKDVGFSSISAFLEVLNTPYST